MSGSSTGLVVGFQGPEQFRDPKKRRAVEALVRRAFGRQAAESFLVSCDDGTATRFLEHVDAGRLTEAVGVAGRHIAEQTLRLAVRARLAEIVRKKPGGGGYVLYSPNKGKKKAPKPVSEFPTKLQAKRAELARFPPPDTAQLKKLRKEVERLGKNPKKAAERERQWAQAKPPKTEAALRRAVFAGILDGLAGLGEGFDAEDDGDGED